MRFPGFQNSADAAKAVAKLLRSDFWLPTLRPNTRYARLQDDHDGKRWGILSVMFGEDSDAWVSIDMNGVEMIDRTIRFRLPVVGGGRSARTRTALHILAEAIRLDNEERAQDLSPHPSVIERMRAAQETSVTPASAPAEPSTSECITGYWFCANCHLCNSETIHHTSCPTCGGLRPTANRRNDHAQ